MINEGDFTLKQTINDQAVNIRQANIQTLSNQANDIQTANMQPVEIQTANKQGGTATADQVRLNQEAAPIRLSANPDAIGFAYTKEQAGAKAEQQRMTQLANELSNSQEKESNSVGLTTAKTLTKEETAASKSMLMTNMAIGEKKNSSEIETYSQSSRTEENSGQEPGLEDLVNLTQVKGNVQVQDRASSKPDLPIWAQVAREVHDKAYQARPHLREMEIQLHPAELGQIRLSLRWEDGQVHLRMMASELGTGQMLQANLSELRDNLAQLGVQCGMMEMNMGNQQGNSREQGRNKSSQLRVESEDFQETQSVQTILDVESSSKINVTA
jgi:flagellar hook-length control protein FliK